MFSFLSSPKSSSVYLSKHIGNLSTIFPSPPWPKLSPSLMDCYSRLLICMHSLYTLLPHLPHNPCLLHPADLIMFMYPLSPLPTTSFKSSMTFRCSSDEHKTSHGLHGLDPTCFYSLIGHDTLLALCPPAFLNVPLLLPSSSMRSSCHWVVLFPCSK